MTTLEQAKAKLASMTSLHGAGEPESYRSGGAPVFSRRWPILGYASVFNADYQYAGQPERVLPGAFVEPLPAVTAMIDHRHDWPGTVGVWQDGFGLLVGFDPEPVVDFGSPAWRMLDRFRSVGFVGMSFQARMFHRFDGSVYKAELVEEITFTTPYAEANNAAIAVSVGHLPMMPSRYCEQSDNARERTLARLRRIAARMPQE